MKKFTIIIAAVLLAGGSCSKDFNGSYPHQKPVDLHTYMEGFVEFYLTDHLWVMERALSFDERALYESIPTSAEYTTGGKSIWTVGTVWTASEVQSLSGITIERAQDDSTWYLRRNDKAGIRGMEVDYPVDSDVTLRMLPTAEDAAVHDWRLTVTRCIRTEDLGYKADLTMESESPAEFRATAPAVKSWNYCKGNFVMTVTKDGAKVDKGLLSYDGDGDSAVFYHNL